MKFKNARPGNRFKFKGRVLVKTREFAVISPVVGDFNAINLADGALFYILPDEEVILTTQMS